MSENSSTDTAKIRALKTSVVSLLEKDREDGVPIEKLRQGAGLLVEAYQECLNIGSKQLVADFFDDFGTTLRTIDDAYTAWRAVDNAFQDTLKLAYSGYVPRSNLLIDIVHRELKQRIGEPVAALHARLHAAWNDHLRGAPWDAYLADSVEDANSDGLNASLKSLVHGDHLDVEDAVEELTGTLRYTFANYLETADNSLQLLEESLWMRPEIVIMNDYWRHNTQVRILEVLRRRKKSKYSGSFAKVQDFFAAGAPTSSFRAPEQIVGDVKSIRPEEKETYLRCLMLHPDQEVRRYAVNNVDVESFWKVVTPGAVPCAAILSMLEKVAGSQNYDENFQKIFFQTINRRLTSLASRSDVIYARGIIRILARLPFFMEEEYFEKLMAAIDYLTAKEKVFGIEDGVLNDYIDGLRREKDKIGTLRTESASLASIPPVVLRKLARDGHFWYNLATHPMYKIARETITHINSQDRALRIANNHGVNQDVLREVGRKRSLYSTLSSRVALLSNPRTPPTISLGYLMDMTKTDVERLLRTSTIHPELRPHLQNRLRT